MSATEQQINNRLDELESLLSQIGERREKARVLKAELVAVEEEYTRVVGAANDEAEHLVGEKVRLTALLTDKPPSQPENKDKDNDKEKADPPPEELRVDTRRPVDPPPVREDPRFASKQALRQYLDAVAALGQEEELKSIRAMQTDGRLDLADMLERLSWGPIWKERKKGETADDQYLRLGSWQAALTERRDYWQRIVGTLEADRERGLSREKRARSPEAWLAYLGERAAEQQQENERLRNEVAVLEQQWQIKQAQAGTHG